MGFWDDKGKTDKSRKVNDVARKVAGNSGKTNANGDLLGVTRVERENAKRKLMDMVERGEIKMKQADKAVEAANRQAGAKGGFVARRFGR